MILFLSSAFLRRLRLQWKPDLKGFLVGDRNLFFFYPDLFLESAEINVETIDAFLQAHRKEKSQLIGFLTPKQLEFLPGYAELNTGNVYEPKRWDARLHLLGDQGEEQHKLEIRMGESTEGV